MTKCVFRVKQGYNQLYTIICHKCLERFDSIHSWEVHAEIHIIHQRRKTK